MTKWLKRVTFRPQSTRVLLSFRWMNSIYSHFCAIFHFYFASFLLCVVEWRHIYIVNVQRQHAFAACKRNKAHENSMHVRCSETKSRELKFKYLKAAWRFVCIRIYLNWSGENRLRHFKIVDFGHKSTRKSHFNFRHTNDTFSIHVHSNPNKTVFESVGEHRSNPFQCRNSRHFYHEKLTLKIYSHNFPLLTSFSFCFFVLCLFRICFVRLLMYARDSMFVCCTLWALRYGLAFDFPLISKFFA